MDSPYSIHFPSINLRASNEVLQTNDQEHMLHSTLDRLITYEERNNDLTLGLLNSAMNVPNGRDILDVGLQTYRMFELTVLDKLQELN